MSQKARVVLAWSSGKDSAWALLSLQQRPDVEVLGLLTSFNDNFNRVAMHGVRETLVERQAEACGLPLFKVPLPWPCSNEQYESTMETALKHLLKEHDITHVAFGDLFLADIRAYREEKMQALPLTPMFPLWGLDTKDLAHAMIDAGMQAFIACLDPRKVPAELAGTLYNYDFLKALPADVDPCGEHGEFHTFVYAGPMYTKTLAVEPGIIVERDGFVFADIQIIGKD